MDFFLSYASLAGLALDLIGFSIIALEWRFSMYDALSRLEIEQDLQILRRGESPQQRVYPHELSPSAMKLVEVFIKNHDKGKAKELNDEKEFELFMKQILIVDTVERLDRRMKWFTLGFMLVLLGFALQILTFWNNA
ncbi:hypothetical protein WNY59_08330 [Ahrensia kielensis]|uniref:Uncharacterized protein n=1 Tax=Ahrensia kielensis TaxID=76980 RepID=A0ABU9T634_9HYPH